MSRGADDDEKFMSARLLEPSSDGGAATAAAAAATTINADEPRSSKPWHGCPWTWQRKFSVAFGLFIVAYLVFVGVTFRVQIQYGFDQVSKFLGVGGALQQFLDGPGAEYWAPFVFGLVYVAACVLLVPASALTILAGFLWAYWLALLIVSLSSTVGATCAFLLGRTALRGWVRRKTAKFPKFVAVQAALSKTSWLVFLLRLSPVIPFNILNYAISLSDVPTLHYIAYSWVGMLPGTALYVYIGYATKHAIAGATEETALWEKILKYGVGPLVSLIVVIAITIIARRQLNKQIDKSNSENGGDRQNE